MARFSGAARISPCWLCKERDPFLFRITGTMNRRTLSTSPSLREQGYHPATADTIYIAIRFLPDLFFERAVNGPCQSNASIPGEKAVSGR
jgi:hypothetical protein